MVLKSALSGSHFSSLRLCRRCYDYITSDGMFPSQTIAKALQEYGVYIMDSTSGGLGLYALNPNSLSIDPYNDLIFIPL